MLTLRYRGAWRALVIWEAAPGVQAVHGLSSGCEDATRARQAPCTCRALEGDTREEKPGVNLKVIQNQIQPQTIIRGTTHTPRQGGQHPVVCLLRPLVETFPSLETGVFRKKESMDGCQEVGASEPLGR